jgi:hypothetical protein
MYQMRLSRKAKDAVRRAIDRWSTPHSLVFVIVWLVTTIATIVMLSRGVWRTGQYETVRRVLHVVYVAALLWYLVREGPSLKDLPEIEPLLLRRRPTGRRAAIGRWIPVVGVALALALAALGQGGALIVVLLLPIPIVWTLVARRREIHLRPVLLALALTALAFLGGLPSWKHDFIGKDVFIFLLGCLPIAFVAGGLLHKRTGLGGSPLWVGQYRKALGSFLWGCLVFAPLGLFSATGDSPATGITWVNRAWMPFTLWFSAMTEETLCRFFLVGLCYLYLRPALRGHPALAAGCAAFFSATVFGLAHEYTPYGFLVTGLLYSLPMAVAFVSRDWEHAFSAHYMINMIPWLMVFLER